MQDYIRPYADIIVKYLLGSEQNKDLLLSFINAVLADSGFTKIVDVELADKLNEKEYFSDKASILDIKARDEKGRLFNIEVQILRQDDFAHRSLYYWAKTYSSQIKEGDAYFNLKPTICINLLCFELLKNLDKIHSCFMLSEKSLPEYILTEHEIMHFIELPKYEKLLEKQEISIDPMSKKWIEFFIYEGKEKEKMIVLLNDDTIKKAHEQYTKFTADEQMQRIYETRWKDMIDRNSLLETGRREGKTEGKIEGKIEAAKSMLADGLSIETIMKYTSLTREEIEKLK